MSASLPSSPLQRWQLRTAASLSVGYSAYYLCRSNLAIVAPRLMREFGSRGLNKEVLGQLASVGVPNFTTSPGLGNGGGITLRFKYLTPERTVSTAHYQASTAATTILTARCTC